MVLDLAIYCIIKVLINYQLISCYQTSQGSSKKILELFIDENIMNVYNGNWVNKNTRIKEISFSSLDLGIYIYSSTLD